MTESLIILTFDTDWAPDFVLDDTMRMVAEHGIRGTIFSTGEIPLAASERLEIGIHPNLMADSTQGEGEYDIVSRLRSAVPMAQSVRTHRLYWHNGLVSIFTEAGFKYDSSLCVPYHPGLRPTRIGEILRLPMWWGDNLHLMEGRRCDRLDIPRINSKGIKVFNFHPIHLYLNTRSLVEYRKTLTKIAPLPNVQRNELIKHVTAGPGMRNLFESLIAYCKRTDQGNLTFGEIMEDAVG